MSAVGLITDAAVRSKGSPFAVAESPRAPGNKCGGARGRRTEGKRMTDHVGAEELGETGCSAPERRQKLDEM